MGEAKRRQQAIVDAASRTTYHEQDGKVLVNTYQDVEPHLEFAKKLRRADAEERGAFGKRKDLHRTMSVPFNVILGVAQRLGIPAARVFDKEYSQRIMAELKRPEFAGFRTTNDKLI